MNWRMSAARCIGISAAVTLTAGLAACAPEAAGEAAAPYKAPTMAPEQSITEACGLSRVEVDRMVTETEASVKAGLEQAGQDLLSGTMPSFDFLALSIDDSLASVESQITNSEVAAALGRINDGFSGFGEIQQPESILGVPAYLASLSSQLGALSDAGQDLRGLCGTN